jgi:hypothetical protein
VRGTIEDRIEGNHVGWPGVFGMVKEDELHTSGTGGKNAEVCSFCSDRRTEGIGKGGMGMPGIRIKRLNGLRA